MVKVTQNVTQYLLHNVTYSSAKFEVATSNGLGGDPFTRNSRTYILIHTRTDRGRIDFGTKLIYAFFLKKKAGIMNTKMSKY